MSNTLYNNQQVNTVGTTGANLVLLTLGKVYIKTGRNAELLTDIIKRIAVTDTSSLSILYVSDTEELLNLSYPGDGIFIFNKSNSVLYLSLDNKYIPIVDTTAVEGNYVKKSGDTMTGLLEIITNDAPFIISSNKLVSNLNAEYLNGSKGTEFTKRSANERITGKWTFGNKLTAEDTVTFKANTRHYGDLVTSGSVGSPTFSGGFAGQGWRIDEQTSTLTIDNIVVRKAMLVYKMVINQISATNGSLWVSNSSTVESVYTPYIITQSGLNALTFGTGNNITNYFTTGEYYLLTFQSNLEKNVSTDSNYLDGSGKTFYNYKYLMYVIDATKLANTLTLITDLTNEFTNTVDTFSLSTLLLECVTLIPIHYQIESELYVEAFDREVYQYIVTDIDNYKSQGLKACSKVKTYYKYFGVEEEELNNSVTLATSALKEDRFNVEYPRMYVIDTDKDQYPLFKPGDILRCLKYENRLIKYYDAVVLSLIDERRFIIEKGVSVFDQYSTFQYDENGDLLSVATQYNTTLYSKTSKYYNAETGEWVEKSSSTIPTSASLKALTSIEVNDDLIQIGSLSNLDRQGAVYITSTDDLGPYMDILSDVSRPDYSVSYIVPQFKTAVINTSGLSLTYYLIEITYEEYQALEPDVPSYKEAQEYLGTINYDVQTQVFTDSDGNVLYLDGQMLGYIGDDSDEMELIVSEDNTFCIALDTPVVYKYYRGVLSQEDDCALLYNAIGYLSKQLTTTKVRLGRLDGIYNEIFGNNQPHGYGLYGLNVYLTGEFFLSNGQSVAKFGDDITLLTNLTTEQYEATVKAINKNQEALEAELEESSKNLDSKWTALETAGLYVKDNKLALIGGLITVYTTKEEMESGSAASIPTAVFANHKLTAELIDVSTLSVDKLICYRDEDNGIYNYTINLYGAGETIYYWDDNSIMNVKVIYTNDEGAVSGCVEYFLQKGSYTDYTKLLSDDPKLGESGVIKKFDYFKSTVINSGSNSILYYVSSHNLDIWKEHTGSLIKGTTILEFILECATIMEKASNTDSTDALISQRNTLAELLSEFFAGNNTTTTCWYPESSVTVDDVALKSLRLKYKCPNAILQTIENNSLEYVYPYFVEDGLYCSSYEYSPATTRLDDDSSVFTISIFGVVDGLQIGGVNVNNIESAT